MKKFLCLILCLLLAGCSAPQSALPENGSSAESSSAAPESVSASESLPESAPESESAPEDSSAAFEIPEEGSMNADYVGRYENGLRVNLPYRWWGRFTVEEDTGTHRLDDGEFTYASYAFLLGGDSGRKMFTIYAILNTDYEALPIKDKVNGFGTYLGCNDVVSFAYHNESGENPFPVDSEDFTLFGELCRDVAALPNYVSIDYAAATEGRSADTSGFSSVLLTGGASVWMENSQLLFPASPTAELLATRIEESFIFGGNGLSDFEGAGKANKEEMLAAALYHTSAVYVNISYRHGEPDSLQMESGQEGGRLRRAAKAALEAGIGPDYLYYGEDVRKTAALVFGSEATLTMADSGKLYHYYADADVFVRQGDYGGPVGPCPQILSYEQTADGYTCEAAIALWIGDPQEIWAGDDAYASDTVLTPENARALLEQTPRYCYTYTTENGRLVLTGFQAL